MAISGVQRGRVFLAEYGRPFGILLFVLAVLVFIGGFALFLSPPTETVTTETNQQTIEGTHDVSVTVTNATNAYEEGTVLRNKPIYLTPAGKNATVTVGIDAPSGTDATVTTVVRYQATYEDETEPFYTDDRTLSQTTVSGDENATVTVNSERIRQRTVALQNEFGANVDVTAQVVTLVGYDTGTYTGTLEVVSGMSFPTTGTYRLQPADNQVVRVTEEEVTQVDNSRTIATTDIRINLVGSVILALIIAVAGEFARRSHRSLSVEAERAELEASRYEEFITRMEGPLSCPRPTEYVNSVRELVKYAKTTGEQVLHCQTTGVFIIVDGERVIMYDPERRAREAGTEPDITYTEDEEGNSRLGLLDTDEPATTHQGDDDAILDDDGTPFGDVEEIGTDESDDEDEGAEDAGSDRDDSGDDEGSSDT